MDKGGGAGGACVAADCTERARDPPLELLLESLLPLPVLLVELTESELDDRERDCERGPLLGDTGARLGEWGVLDVWPVVR